MNNQEIAIIAHEVNRAYCKAIGDNSQLTWYFAPEWQRESAVKGVEFIRKNPMLSPAASHEAWCKEKEADGWVYGPIKVPENKKHPCLMPFDDLPQAQRAKDYVFQAVVLQLILAE